MSTTICEFSVCIYYEEYIYFFEIESGMPARINLHNYEVEFLELPKGFKIENGDTYDLLIENRHCIYGVKTNGKEILCWDLKENYCEYISLFSDCDAWGNFVSVECYKDKIYIFRKKRGIVAVLDTRTWSIEKYHYNIEINWDVSCKKENSVVLISSRDNVIGLYDLDNEKMCIMESEHTLPMLIDITYDGKKTVGMSKNGEVFEVNNCFDFIKCDYRVGNKSIKNKILKVKDIIIELPIFDGMITIINTVVNKEEIIDLNRIKLISMNHPNWSMFKGMCKDENYYYFAMRRTKELLTINRLTGELQWRKIKLRQDSHKYENYLKSMGYVKEEEGCTLSDFIVWEKSKK